MTRILTDADVEAAGMPVAVQCMEDAFRQHAAGTLVAPGRLVSDVEAGQMVFTVGASTSDDPVVGFRYYDLKHLYSQQLTAVFSASDGSLHGLVVGPLLGAVRTGAIGGVAIKYLAREDAETLGILGSGYQARTQLGAALAVRDFRTIRVHSRDAQRRRQFAVDMSREFDREIAAVDSAQEVVENADVLICATTSSTPVVEAAWLKAGVHINNVGPKFKSQHELATEIYQLASRLVTDAPAQLEAAGEDFILHGTPREDSVERLSSFVAQHTTAKQNVNQPDDAASVFISLGLAGTEVLLAKKLLDL
jgi:ornithine cyclodeaminase